ncbi:MAG: sulfatase-like hydrolase/transferase, partial [Actinomycetota bacterium]|nr:sulfatase-like hydrolase/transferase [Actinomycetota bacterium]
PEAFIAARAGTARILLFVAVITFGPFLVAAGALLAINRWAGPRFADVAYRTLLGIAAFVAASAVVHQVMADSNLATPLAVLVAGAVVWAESKVDWVRTWLRLLAVVAVVAPALFLGVSDAAELVWQPEAAADTTVTVANEAPVVMLVFDELPLSSLVRPNGTINGDLFPNFARLAAGSHWFKNGQSNSIATTASIPILLTGHLAEGARPTSRDHPLSLFTMLGDTYAMDVRETITSLCPNSVCAADAATSPAVRDELGASAMLVDASIVWGHLTQPPWVRSRLPAIDGQWGGFLTGPSTGDGAADTGLPLAPPGERLTWIDTMLDAAAGLEDAAGNTLHYTHALAPHIPWQANPSGTQYHRPEQLGSSVAGVENGYWLEDPSRAVQGYQRHLFQLGLVDRLVGRIIDSLQASGAWDDGIIVVTADHGGSFDPGEHRRWVTPTNLDALYRVPLFIRVPGQQAGEVHIENAYLQDVLPTIVDVLGIELGPEWEFAGMSLFDEDLPEARPHDYDHFTGHRQALGGAVDGLADEVIHLRTLVPDQSSWAAVAAVGPHADMVGRPLSSLAPTASAEVIAEFDQAEVYQALDPAAGIVPTVLTGRLALPAGVAASDVLVAVNGTVSGAGYVVAAGAGTASFSALVPEEAYVSGSNEVTLLIPTDSGRWIAATDGSVAPLVLRDADGDELDVVPPMSRRVVIDHSVIEGDRLQVKGWSADTAEKVIPSEILVFFGDQLAFHGPTNLVRGDVPEWFGSKNLELAGFQIEIPAADIPDGTQRVTVAARFGDVTVVEYSTITE